jgi:hypothetical protein
MWKGAGITADFYAQQGYVKHAALPGSFGLSNRDFSVAPDRNDLPCLGKKWPCSPIKVLATPLLLYFERFFLFFVSNS